MGARVRLHVEAAGADRLGGGALELVALANSGYEADAPELILPVAAATRLGLWPHPPRGAVEQRYQTPAGEFVATRIPSGVRVRLVVADRRLPARTAAAVVSMTEREAILSAELGSRLGIATIDPGEGIWALRAELTHLRRSAPPQYW